MALTRSQINKRYYQKHKKKENERSKKYYKLYYPKVAKDRRQNYRNRMHQVSNEWLKSKLIEQNHTCAVCFQPFEKTPPHIDHDHSCAHRRGSCDKCRRGLLCEDCNLGLGRMKDSPRILMSAIQYLQRYGKNESVSQLQSPR